MLRRNILKIKEEEEKKQALDKIKQANLAKYRAHVDLITQVKSLTPLEFANKILIDLDRFDDFIIEGIPTEEKTGKTLFHAILEHNNLDNATKCQLIENLIHHKGYSLFYKVIFQSALVETILKNSEFNDFLKYMYCEYLIETIDSDFEHRIWKSILVVPDNGTEVFKELLNHRMNHGKVLQFIEYWFTAIQDKEIIPNICQLIEKLADESLKTYLPYVEKLARCRILKIEYDQVREGHSVADEKSEEKVKEFLQHHDHTLLSIHPSSLWVYEKIKADEEHHGKHEYLSKMNRVEQEVNEQLATDHLTGCKFKIDL